MMRVSGSESESKREEMRKRFGVRDISTPLGQQSGLRGNLRCREEGKGRVGTQHNTTSPFCACEDCHVTPERRGTEQHRVPGPIPEIQCKVGSLNCIPLPVYQKGWIRSRYSRCQTHPPYLPIVKLI